AFALRRAKAFRRDVLPSLHERLRPRNGIAAVLQRLWAKAGFNIAIQRSLGSLHSRGLAGPTSDDLWRWPAVSRFHLRAKRCRGESVGVPGDGRGWTGIQYRVR